MVIKISEQERPNQGWFWNKIGLAGKTELHVSQTDSQPDPDHPDDLEPDPVTRPECPTLVLNRKLVAQFFAGDRFFEDFYNEGIEIFIFSQILVLDFYCSIKILPLKIEILEKPQLIAHEQ